MKLNLSNAKPCLYNTRAPTHLAQIHFTKPKIHFRLTKKNYLRAACDIICVNNAVYRDALVHPLF